MHKLLVAAAALFFFLSTAATPTEAAARPVVMLHGATGVPAVYDSLKADLQAKGYTVHALKLPKSGLSRGDSKTNAEYAYNYMTQNNLTNVVLVGHSLGGTVEEYVTRILDTSGRVTGRVTLDSSIAGPGDSAYSLGCWFVPDQCSNSTVRTALNNANKKTNIPWLNVSDSGVTNSAIDFNVRVRYNGSYSHMNYPSIPAVKTRVLTFAGCNC